MAREIVQMYDKYHSTKKVYPKVIEECLPEGIVGVEANPTLAGTEADLTGIKVGDTAYKVPTPTTVVANPELAGTEGDLEGLQVGETKYKVGGGKQLYLHNITISRRLADYTDIECYIWKIDDNPTAYTFDTFKQWLEDNNFKVATNIYYPYANGVWASSSNTAVIYGVKSGSTNQLDIKYVKPGSSQTYGSIAKNNYNFYDNVTTL